MAAFFHAERLEPRGARARRRRPGASSRLERQLAGALAPRRDRRRRRNKRLHGRRRSLPLRPDAATGEAAGDPRRSTASARRPRTRGTPRTTSRSRGWPTTGTHHPRRPADSRWRDSPGWTTSSSPTSLNPDQTGWDWFSLQFDDGTELMLFRLRRKDGSAGPLLGRHLHRPAGPSAPPDAR